MFMKWEVPKNQQVTVDNINIIVANQLGGEVFY